jgi:CRISPR-associated protein Cmr5
MSLRTIEQQRAEFAYSKIGEVKRINNEKKKKEYKSLVRNFASMILQNGLGQALAFLLAKRDRDDNRQIIQDDPHNLLFDHINEWLKRYFNEENNFNVLQKICDRNTDSIKYRLYTKETLNFLVWLKKFAEAELSD